MSKAIFSFFTMLLILGCFDDSLEEKGFPINNSTETRSDSESNEPGLDSLRFETRPRNVLLTFHPAHRLTPIYKVNYNKRTNEPFVGSNNYYSSYWEFGEMDGNHWHNNFMPGFEAVYGYNFVNISHHNAADSTDKLFFEKPVLIKTLYYPAFSKDTLNQKPMFRNHYMVSAYDEDTNKDGLINLRDLRRFFLFDLDLRNSELLVPINYSVIHSEYDPANDFMYVFAVLDDNGNGQIDSKEPMHIFWVNLSDPKQRGAQYKD
jgi:hypothetical protein